MNRLYGSISSGADFILPIFFRAFDILFPRKCIACQCVISPLTAVPSPKQDWTKLFQDDDLMLNAVMQPFICADCCGKIQRIKPPLCRRCGWMFPRRQKGNHWCEHCIKQPGYIKFSRSYALFQGPFMEAVRRYKYLHKIQLAQPFGLLLFSLLIKYWDLSAIDIVTPVPLHFSKMYWRGFNQTYFMVRGWHEFARLAGIDITHIQILPSTLKKIKKTRPQVGLNRQERALNVAGSFGVVRRDMIQDKSVLLIDDVITTGATSNECAKILLASGANSVSVMSLARAL